MCDYRASTQLNDWIFSFEDLEACRKHANHMARKYLSKSGEKPGPSPFYKFACGFSKKKEIREEILALDEEIPVTSNDGHPFLDPQEEGKFCEMRGDEWGKLMQKTIFSHAIFVQFK